LRLEVECTESLFVLGEILSKDVPQCLCLLRTEEDGLVIADGHLVRAVAGCKAEDEREVPHADADLDTVCIGFAIVGGLNDIHLRLLRGRRHSSYSLQGRDGSAGCGGVEAGRDEQNQGDEVGPLFVFELPTRTVAIFCTRENPWIAALHPVNMPQPSIHVRNLLETAVLHLQHSPDLSEEEVRWIQELAAHLITEFSVLKEPDLLYAPLEEDATVGQPGQLIDPSRDAVDDPQH
jgi:hypothetical protein